MKSSAPASSAITRWVVWLSPVIMTTGSRRPRGMALIRRQTSYPSMRGMRTSSSTKDGGAGAVRGGRPGPQHGERCFELAVRGPDVTASFEDLGIGRAVRRDSLAAARLVWLAERGRELGVD